MTSLERHLRGLVAWLLVAPVCTSAQEISTPDLDRIPHLNSEQVEVWTRYIDPSPEERAFEKIPWHPSLGEGLLEAQRSPRPLLLWVMNGHPLGCT